MTIFEPSALGLLVAVMAVSAGLLVLARRFDLLEQRGLEHCAACGRPLEPGRRCPCTH
jgi:hypothetical protein